MKYAKLVDNKIEFPPKNKGSVLNYDTNYSLLIQDGYKEFIEAQKPSTNRRYHIEYIDNIDNIAETIVYDETQEEADARELNEAKELKKQEALDKAYDFEQNGSVEYKNCVFEMSLSNRQNLKDTIDALIATGQESTSWNDKNDEIVVLTIEDIQYIRLNLILGKIRNIWIEEYPNYLAEIEAATTKEEIEAIVINYESEEE